MTWYGGLPKAQAALRPSDLIPGEYPVAQCGSSRGADKRDGDRVIEMTYFVFTRESRARRNTASHLNTPSRPSRTGFVSSHQFGTEAGVYKTM